MIIRDLFDTKALKLLNKKVIIDAINEYLVIDYPYIKEKYNLNIKPFSSDFITLNPVILFGLTTTEERVPLFYHPVINENKNYIALDLRSYVKADKKEGTYKIRNANEYSLVIIRYLLSAMWAINKESELYALKFPHIVFAEWLSDNLTKRFGLSIANQIQLKVLGLIYYMSLFQDSVTLEDINKLIIRTRGELFVSDIVKEVYSKIDAIDTIDDFCKACYSVTENPRIKDLNYPVLINVVANNWFGVNAKELILTSLEHPPTFISLVYASLTQASFKKSYLANIVTKLDRKGKGSEFLKQLANLIKEYKEDAM